MISGALKLIQPEVDENFGEMTGTLPKLRRLRAMVFAVVRRPGSVLRIMMDVGADDADGLGKEIAASIWHHMMAHDMALAAVRRSERQRQLALG